VFEPQIGFDIPHPGFHIRVFGQVYVGLMGETATETNVNRFLSALRDCLKK